MPEQLIFVITCYPCSNKCMMTATDAILFAVVCCQGMS